MVKTVLEQRPSRPNEKNLRFFTSGLPTHGPPLLGIATRTFAGEPATPNSSGFSFQDHRSSPDGHFGMRGFGDWHWVAGLRGGFICQASGFFA